VAIVDVVAWERMLMRWWSGWRPMVLRRELAVRIDVVVIYIYMCKITDT